MTTTAGAIVSLVAEMTHKSTQTDTARHKLSRSTQTDKCTVTVQEMLREIKSDIVDLKEGMNILLDTIDGSSTSRSSSPHVDRDLPGRWRQWREKLHWPGECPAEKAYNPFEGTSLRDSTGAEVAVAAARAAAADSEVEGQLRHELPETSAAAAASIWL